MSILFLKKHDPYQLLKPTPMLLKLRHNKASKNDQAILQFIIKNADEKNEILTSLQQKEKKSPAADSSKIPIADPRVKHTFMTDGGFPTSAPLQRMQADLAYMSWTGDPTGSKQKKRRRHPESYKKSRGILYKFLLVIVDMYSTRTYLYPLTLKDEKNISKAFQEFFESVSDRRLSGETMFLQTDQGTEFYNPSMSRLYNHYKVDHYSTKANGGHAYAP